MNDQCLPLREVLVSQGAPNHVGINSRKLAREAVASGCTCAYLAHNHPSGVALPSAEDIQTTETVRYALSAMGVHLLDHIIVAEDDYISLAAAKEQKRKEQEQQQRQQETEAL